MEREAFWAPDSESVSKTLVDFDSLELQEEDTLFKTAVDEETFKLAADA